MNIEEIEIKKLKPYAKNAKTHPPEQVAKIALSIQEFGFKIPVLVDANLNIIAGHGRILAAESIGLTKVPCIRCDDLNENQVRAFRIMDNKSAQSDWDMELLIPELEELKALDVNLDLTGWDEMELADIGVGEPAPTEADAEPQVDRAEELNKVWQVEVGDLWQIGEHRLLCGDSTKAEDVARVMDDDRIDMIFIDPPYAVNYGHDQKELQEKSGGKLSKRRASSHIQNDDLTTQECADQVWSPTFKNLFDFSKDDCSFYMTMCHGGDQMMMMMMMMNQHWQIKHELIWVKNAPVFSMGRLDYDYQHEPILFGWKKKHNFYGKGQFTKSIWTINKPTASIEHPTMKPVELVMNAILNSSIKDNIVADFFIGSGTTMVACQNLGRKFRGIEISPGYVAVCLQRMKDAFPDIEIKRVK